MDQAIEPCETRFSLQFSNKQSRFQINQFIRQSKQCYVSPLMMYMHNIQEPKNELTLNRSILGYLNTSHRMRSGKQQQVISVPVFLNRHGFLDCSLSRFQGHSFTHYFVCSSLGSLII